jgi:Zn-dependent protease with chaperone function
MSPQRGSGPAAKGAAPSRPSGGGDRQRARNRRPPQQRSARPAAPAPRSTAPRPIDPWAPSSTGSIRVVIARMTPLVVVIVGAVVAAVGLVVAGIVLAAIGAAVLAVNERVGGPNRVITRIGGRTLTSTEQPGLRNIVEGLCVASGQPVPELRLLEDDAPNALTLARRKAPSVLFCTTGLLRDMKRIELEGIVAHELAHLKNGDAHRAAHAMAACGTLALVTRVTPRLVLSLGDPRREVLADLAATAMTRYPPGLRAALATIANAPSIKVRSIDEITYRLTAPLWCAPLDDGEEHRVRMEVLDLELRVETLAEL